MDELRMVRRENGALILANELGDEYRFAVDDVVASEIRQLNKRPAGPSTVRPREIQTLLRSGKTRAEVAEETGLEEADVERFEEPVRAEQRYMLDLARMVNVRTDPVKGTSGESDDQHFGEVIAERLVGLGNTTSSWRSWRDETTGWLIGLKFDSRDGDHDAIWSLDHRKRVLTPLSPDATNLSKAGEVGDRLIPKLRAVENEQGERFDSAAFDPDALLAETAEYEHLQTDDATLFGLGTLSSHATAVDTDAGFDSQDTDAEYERRKEIDSLAVSTTSNSHEDLSQTADLLDALRRRRGEREQDSDLKPAAASDRSTAATNDTELPGLDTEEAPTVIDPDDAPVSDDTEEAPKAAAKSRSGAARNIWGASGVSGAPRETTSALRPVNAEHSSPPDSVDSPANKDASPSAADKAANAEQQHTDSKPSKRGRSSIPSWDDILFGTRSDDDPA